ncbi:MAG: glycosyltransferase [Candidatus Hydrothermarchaeaceae archaeon]
MRYDDKTYTRILKRPKDISEKIDSLLRNPGRLEEMGANARAFTEKYFDWNERAAIYPEIFKDVAERDFVGLKEIPLIVEVGETEFA